MRGMLDMLGDPAKMTSTESTPVDLHQHQDRDEDKDRHEGDLNEASGVQGGGGGGGRGKYSLLLPHLLDLVAYQSGVDAVEVSATCEQRLGQFAGECS